MNISEKQEQQFRKDVIRKIRADYSEIGESLLNFLEQQTNRENKVQQ